MNSFFTKFDVQQISQRVSIFFALCLMTFSTRIDSTSFTPACSSLNLRGGATSIRPQLRTSASVAEISPEEQKPTLPRSQSVLVFNESLKSDVKAKTPVKYMIDGKEVSEEEYSTRVQNVQQRNLDPWIAQSDCGGLKEGDILVPDHCPSVPEAVARVQYNGTVYIRKGTYKWDGVLVVQKHLHIRGEPEPTEGVPGGKGRPTLEGRWLLGEHSSGSFKHVNCIARFNQPPAQ